MKEVLKSVSFVSNNKGTFYMVTKSYVKEKFSKWYFCTTSETEGEVEHVKLV